MMMTAMIQTMMAMMMVATTKKKRTCRCSTIPCVWILQLLLWKCLTAQWVIENHTNKQFSSDNNIGWHENTELVEGRNKLFALSFLLWIRCHAGARPKLVQFIEKKYLKKLTSGLAYFYSQDPWREAGWGVWHQEGFRQHNGNIFSWRNFFKLVGFRQHYGDYSSEFLKLVNYRWRLQY